MYTYWFLYMCVKCDVMEKRTGHARDKEWRQTDRQTDTGDFIICPMLWYSNGTDNKWLHILNRMGIHIHVCITQVYIYRGVYNRPGSCTAQSWQSADQSPTNKRFVHCGRRTECLNLQSLQRQLTPHRTPLQQHIHEHWTYTMAALK